MNSFILQAFLPFILSAFVVIIIMYIAEKYGTKTGGIFGTLPSTIVVAFIFISINKGVDFASLSAAVVPAELGINLIFLFCFAILVHRSTLIAFIVSICVWAICSYTLYVINLNNIFVSLLIFLILFLFTFITLEKIIKIPSKSNVKIKYTPIKIALRGILAGIVIAIAVYLSNVGSTLSGIFSVFPAILSSTMQTRYTSWSLHGKY